MEMLTERRQAILGIVVSEYIATATPVASHTVAQRYPLKVSPATIRNEMAALEELGYLTHPHTSAGRVPTSAGYHFFVERLMEEIALSAAEQRMIRHQFHQVRMDLHQWMKLSAAVLAQMARAVAWATAPKAYQSRLKHLQLIAIRDALALVIVVLQDGSIEQEMISVLTPLSQEDLTRTSNMLNASCSGLGAREIARAVETPSPLEEQVIEVVLRLMQRADRLSGSEMVHDGLDHIFQQPEFAELEQVQRVIHILEGRQILNSLLAEMGRPRQGVQVIIGGEGRWEPLRDYGIVLARYGIAGEAMGTLGVLGPMRMAYERAIPSVRYMADLMSELIHSLYGY